MKVLRFIVVERLQQKPTFLLPWELYRIHVVRILPNFRGRRYRCAYVRSENLTRMSCMGRSFQKKNPCMYLSVPGTLLQESEWTSIVSNLKFSLGMSHRTHNHNIAYSHSTCYGHTENISLGFLKLLYFFCIHKAVPGGVTGKLINYQLIVCFHLFLSLGVMFFYEERSP